MDKKRIVVGVTGASGVIYAVRLLELLRSQAETHLVMSGAGVRVLGLEMKMTVDEVTWLAHHVHDNRDLAAPIASGSFEADGMVVVPCSIKTLSAVANCYSDTLISRAADVMLKQRRRLVLCVRETPFHTGHLRLMTSASESGAVICPPVPGFYSHPESVDDVVIQSVCGVLDLLGISASCYRRWNGYCGSVDMCSGVKF